MCQLAFWIQFGPEFGGEFPDNQTDIVNRVE